MSFSHHIPRFCAAHRQCDSAELSLECDFQAATGSSVGTGLPWLLPLKTTPQQWQRCYVSYYILVVVLEENTTQMLCMFITLGKVTTRIKLSFNLQFIIILDCGQLALSHISHCPLAFLPVHCQCQTMAGARSPTSNLSHCLLWKFSQCVGTVNRRRLNGLLFCMPSPSNTYPGAG